MNSEQVVDQGAEPISLEFVRLGSFLCGIGPPRKPVPGGEIWTQSCGRGVTTVRVAFRPLLTGIVFAAAARIRRKDRGNTGQESHVRVSAREVVTRFLFCRELEEQPFVRYIFMVKGQRTTIAVRGDASQYRRDSQEV